MPPLGWPSKSHAMSSLMAEEPASPEGGAAPVPVTEAPVLAVEPVEAVVPVEAPAPEVPAAEPEPAPEPEAVAEVPPVEPAPEPEKAAEAAPAEGPQVPVYAEFKLPEGLTAQPEHMNAFTGFLGSHGLTQEDGQALLDMHGAVLKQATDQMAQRQIDVFEETRAGWRKDVDKRFGNRRNTAVEDAKWAITDLVRDKAAREELWGVLSFTGAGDHPAVIGALASAGRRLRERNAPAPGLPANPQPANPADRRYGAAPRR